MASLVRAAEPIDDPEVRGYWHEWLLVKDSALMTGWTFAQYVYVKVASKRSPRTIGSTTTNPPWIWERER